MDLTWTDEQETFRAEARAWLEAHVPAGIGSGDTAEGFARHLEWERKLFADRWAVVSWPEAYGGRDASIWEWLIFEEEYYRAGGPQRVTQNGIFLLAPTVFAFGNQEQQDHVLPRMAAAEDLWSQGWSEPNAGSDLASVRSKAERVDGGWVLNGQKTWTTRGAFCTHLFGLFRSDPESERHKGLSYLMIPFELDGVTVRGFGRLDGDEGFAEVFFEDAFLPDDCFPGGPVLGEVDNGWRVAMATTGSERGLTLRSPGRFKATAQRLVDLWHEAPGSDVVRDRLVDAWMRAEAYDAFTLQTVTGIDEGSEPGAESSLNKIWWSELDVELHRVALDLLGPRAELENEWSKGWQFSLSGPIYAGTNEIQRNIAAERVLGLPPGPMKFSLGDDRVEFAAAVRKALADGCDPTVVRAAWDGELDRSIWSTLVEMGTTDPELDWVTRVAVAEEIGRAALPHPWIESAFVVGPIVGETVFASTDAGTPPHVPAGADVDVLLLRGLDGFELVEPANAEMYPVEAVDGSRRLVEIPNWTDGRSATPSVDVVAVGALGTAAVLVGLAQHLLDTTVAYVSERQQFGQPVGGFQAVKHHLANAAKDVAFARPMVHRAAHGLDTDDPGASRDVSTAKALASDAATLTAEIALQCHGAIGYTVEYDLHLWLKRAWALSRAWGDAGHHRARVAESLGL